MSSIQIGEAAVSGLVSLLLKKLGSAAYAEIGQIFKVQDELKRLEITMSAINAVLLDAEEQQSSNNSVRNWLLNLKDVVYDIEDLLDLISTEDLETKIIRKDLVKNFTKLYLRYSFAQKLKAIRKKLDEIAENRRNYSFHDNLALPSPVKLAESRETCSSVLYSHTFGREKEKERIISRLLKASTRDGVNHLVIPITGIGGMGKTTVAKLVLNDPRVVQRFELRLWVYVSRNFVPKAIIAKIIESVVCQDYSSLSMEALQKKLRDILADRAFFLVLDDVWNEDPKKWSELQTLLIMGAKGSAIVVTTREDKVALITTGSNTNHYKLEDLPENHCWSLFVKYAFDEDEEDKYPHLVKIGRLIVEKCSGVPLAVKTLASFLRDKRDDRTWKHIAESRLWEIYQRENDILPVLKLSLDHTPYQLRSCFAFCSLFGKGYAFYRTDIINMWMALGFPQVQNGSEDALDVGHRYFDELLSRSFLQLPCVERYVMRRLKMQGGPNLLQMSYEDVTSQAFTAVNGRVKCTEMHDLVHDLAAYVAGDEIATVSTNMLDISPRVKHIMMDTKIISGNYFPNALLKAGKARSFASMGSVSILFLKRLVSNFKCLRVLLLLHSDFEELPDSIGNLKQLRYLNASGNTQLKLLPNSTSKLLNLQVLDLEYCYQLEMLPKNVQNWASLRVLVLTSKMTCFPESGLQGWISLQVLKITVCPNLTLLPEGLGSLKSLQVLAIWACPKLASLPNSMTNLTNLEHLTIHSCENLDLTGWKGLCNLQSLKFVFGLPKLPDFRHGMESVAGSWQYLRISECKDLISLPECLTHCTCLLKLQVYNCPNLRLLPKGFDNLKALQELHIVGCPELSSMCQIDGTDWNLVSHVPEIYIDEIAIKTRYPTTS